VVEVRRIRRRRITIQKYRLVISVLIERIRVVQHRLRDREFLVRPILQIDIGVRPRRRVEQRPRRIRQPEK